MGGRGNSLAAIFKFMKRMRDKGLVFNLVGEKRVYDPADIKTFISTGKAADTTPEEKDQKAQDRVKAMTANPYKREAKVIPIAGPAPAQVAAVNDDEDNFDKY